MTDAPGADELRMRALLRHRRVGPDAIPPKPTTRPRDWLDDILTSPATPTTAGEKPKAAPPRPPAEPVSKAPPKKRQRKKTKPGKRRGPAVARTAWDTRPEAPRQSLVEAWERIPYRFKWLAYHASAAYLGWSLGLVGWVTHVTAWIDETGLGPQAVFWYAVGASTLLLHHATRSKWWPLAWLAAVPASSTVIGVLLYGTPSP